MRIVHVLVPLVLLSPAASALLPAAGVAPTPPAWTALDDAGAEDEGRGIAVSPDGLVSYTAGMRTGDGGFWDREATVVAHDVATGELLWTYALPSATGPNELWAVAADATRVVAVGTAHDGTGNVFRLDQLVVAIDAATGQEIWRSVLDLGTWTRANAVALSHDAAFVVGNDDLGEGRTRAVVRALDLDGGAQRWLVTFGTFGYNDARDVAVSDGVVYVAGSAYTAPTPGQDMFILALDAATGDERWGARYDGPASGYDAGAAVAVADGVAVLVGTTEGDLDAWGDATTVAYDSATGALRWAARHEGLGRHYDGANDVAIAAGRVLVAGSTHMLPTSPTQPLVVAYAALDGAQQWLALEGGLLPGEPGEGLSVAASPDGATVYMGGRHRPIGGSTDALIVAYGGATGVPAWRGVHTSPPGIYDTVHEIALTPDASRLIVAGLAGAGEVTIAGAGAGATSGADGAEEPHGDILTLAFDA